MRFGIDIDGTVTSPAAIIPFMNDAFGLNLTLDDIKQYSLKPLVNISAEEFSKWFKENEPMIYSGSDLSDGAVDVLNNWKNDHELFFISARGSHLLDITKKWFEKHNITFHRMELIGTHNKVEAVKKHMVDIFFEDKHDNAVVIHEECQIPVILFDTPYNRDPIPDGVIRVQNWHEAAKWVNTWLSEK